jgi:hypothetical protein
MSEVIGVSKELAGAITEAFCDCGVELRGEHHWACPGVADEWAAVRGRIAALVTDHAAALARIEALAAEFGGQFNWFPHSGEVADRIRVAIEGEWA